MKLQDILYEMPQRINASSDYLDEQIIGRIKRSLSKEETVGSVIKPLGNNLYMLLYKKAGDEIYFFANLNGNNLTVLAGVYGDIETYDGKQLFRTAATKKYDETFSRAALKLYSYVSKDVHPWLISDTQQSESSERFWRKWLLNPKKYGIQEIYVFDTKENKRMNYKNQQELDQFWGVEELFQRYRVIVKF